MSLEIHAPIISGSQYKKHKHPLRQPHSTMATLVRIYHPFVLERYDKIYKNDEVPQYLVWILRDYLDDAAQETLTVLGNSEIRDTIALLRYHTLYEI